MDTDKDLTIVYITANEIPESFSRAVQKQLIDASGGLAQVCVSKQPMNWADEHIVFDTPRSHINIYREALAGVKAAKTKYIAVAEDDVLYSPEHFKYRPSSGKFAYNISCWGIYTWGDPIFSHRIYGGRRNHGMLICERDLYIEAMEERFKKFEGKEINKTIWGEPGKYEKQLGVTVRETEDFYTNPPNIMFSHEQGLSFAGLGKRKRLGELRATELPFWGKASDIVRIYR